MWGMYSLTGFESVLILAESTAHFVMFDHIHKAALRLWFRLDSFCWFENPCLEKRKEKRGDFFSVCFLFV